jgi:hypothetical protein
MSMTVEMNRILSWGEGLKRPWQEAGGALADLGKDARHAMGDVGEAVGPLRRSLERTITTHPLKAVLVALAAGVVLGWIIKRS